MSSPVWWLQLVRSTAIERADDMRAIIQEWITGSWGGLGSPGNVNDARLIWAEGAVIPTAFSMQALIAPVDLDGLLERIQPLLGETEFMIFAEMVEGDVFDRAYVNYHLVSRLFIGHYSGDEIAKRAERMALELAEDLQRPPEST